MFPCSKNALLATICGCCALMCASWAKQSGEAPSIYFNLLPFHAGTEQNLYLGAKDPDGVIREIRLQLHERVAGAPDYGIVWTEFAKSDQLMVTDAPLRAVTAGGDFAISVQVRDNDGNETRLWKPLEVKPADIPVISTDLSVFSAPIPEGTIGSLTFTQDDRDGDSDWTVVRLNGLELLSEYKDNRARSVTVEDAFAALQPGKHVLALVFSDHANSRQFAEIRFEISEDPTIGSRTFPLTAKTETVQLGAVFAADKMHEEAFIWASEAVPESGLWPLVVVLHGGGFFDHGIANIRLDKAQVAYHNERGHAVMRVHPASSGSWQVAELNAFLDHLIATYPIDPQRIHLMGHSMGAHGAIDWCAQNAERFATIATHSPYFLTTKKVNTGGVLRPEYLTAAQSKAFCNLPFRAYHAEKDGWRAGSQLLVAELNRHGPELAEFRLVAGKTHAGGMNWFMASTEVTDFQLSHATMGEIPQRIDGQTNKETGGRAGAMKMWAAAIFKKPQLAFVAACKYRDALLNPSSGFTKDFKGIGNFALIQEGKER